MRPLDQSVRLDAKIRASSPVGFCSPLSARGAGQASSFGTESQLGILVRACHCVGACCAVCVAWTEGEGVAFQVGFATNDVHNHIA
mgnify:CR=1 FL=1